MRLVYTCGFEESEIDYFIKLNIYVAGNLTFRILQNRKESVIELHMWTKDGWKFFMAVCKQNIIWNGNTSETFECYRKVLIRLEEIAIQVQDGE